MIQIRKLLIAVTAMVLATTSFADKLDQQIQASLDNFVAQYAYPKSKLFTAMQVSVLMPGESQPRDYVAGIQEIENPSVKATTSMLMQYGSITKEFTNSLLLKYMYAHPGSITISTPLSALFPDKFSDGDWPKAWQNITVVQLMNMTSGIASTKSSSDPKYINPFASETLSSLVQEVATAQLTLGCVVDNGCFPAGSQFYYSNTNYMLLGLIIEQLYSEDFTTVMNDNILNQERSAGNSIYYQIHYTADVLGQMINAYYAWPTNSYVQLGQNITDGNLSYIRSAGALTGNIHGLVELVHDLYFGKIISGQALQDLKQTGFVNTSTAKPVPFDQREIMCKFDSSKGEWANGCFGLGIQYYSNYLDKYGDVYVYGGQTPGYTATYTYLIKYNAILAVGLNTEQASVLQALGPEFYSLLNDVIGEIAAQDKINKPYDLIR